jgi:hypothetical protein
MDWFHVFPNVNTKADFKSYADFDQTRAFSKLVFEIIAVRRETSGFGTLKNRRARVLPLRIRLQMKIEKALGGGQPAHFWPSHDPHVT